MTSVRVKICTFIKVIHKDNFHFGDKSEHFK